MKVQHHCAGPSQTWQRHLLPFGGSTGTAGRERTGHSGNGEDEAAATLTYNDLIRCHGVTVFVEMVPA